MTCAYLPRREGSMQKVGQLRKSGQIHTPKFQVKNRPNAKTQAKPPSRPAPSSKIRPNYKPGLRRGVKKQAMSRIRPIQFEFQILKRKANVEGI